MRFGYPYLTAKLGKRLNKLTRNFSSQKNAKISSPAGLTASIVQLRNLFESRAMTYQAKPYAGRITLFMLAQRNAMSDSLFDPALGYISPSLGWESIAPGGVERHELKGEHVSILKEPFVRELGEQLRECLNREQLMH